MTTDSQQAGNPQATGAQPAADPAAATAVVDPAATPSTDPTANAEAAPADPAAAPAVDPAAKKPDEAPGAPEVYADFTVPDEGVLNPDVAATFKATAKELNLTQDQAQALVTKLQPAMAKATAEGREAAIAQMTAGFEAAIASDKELGGTKAEVDAKVAIAKGVFDKFGTPELRTFLTESRLGNHPELVRWAHRVGKAMNDDGTFVSGNKPSHVPGDDGLANRMYGGTPAK